MAVRIKCKCGKVLTVKDELRGKAVKCPGCASVVRVPAGNAAKSAGQPAAARQSGRPRSPATSELDDLFSEEGFDRVVGAVCPACGAEMKPNAVLCTQCGYNKQTGQRIESHQVAGADVDMGAVALQKARRDMEADQELQDKMLTKSGLPWWMLGLILFMIVSAVTLATLAVNAANRVDEDFNINAPALFLMISAGGFCLVSFAANLMLLIKAFKSSLLEGFLTLLVPFYLLYFCIKHWSDTWRLLATAILTGSVGAGLAVGATVVGARG